MIKCQLTIDASHNLLLSNLPYKSGQKLIVIIMAEDELQQRHQRWQFFFKQLQANPTAQTLTDDDIATEIEAYRSENCHSLCHKIDFYQENCYGLFGFYISAKITT